MTSEDPNLRSIYRSASRESSPESADRAILDLAKHKPEQFWQPFALAATVLLSFAFLANVGLLQPEVVQDIPRPAVESTLNEYAADDMALPARQETGVQLPTEVREAESPAVRSFTPESKSRAVRDDAANLARVLEELKEYDQRSLGESAATAASKRSADDDRPVRYCSEAVSASAGSWYRCVLQLRDDGLDDQADFEQALLLTRYPEFEIR